MKNIAKNFDEFVEKVEAAERTVLNSEVGQEITKKYLELCAKNKSITKYPIFIESVLHQSESFAPSSEGEPTPSSAEARFPLLAL